MEPVSVALICAVVFGTVIALSAFIRQLLLSRNKDLNDKAQLRALAIEAEELKKIRAEMDSRKRFDSHYQMLGTNKESVQYIDEKIEEILIKKSALIERYAQIIIKESRSIVEEGATVVRKELTDQLKADLDIELRFYDKELNLLQNRRASLWGSHGELQSYLLEQEKLRNAHLDELYEHHSSLLEKMYMRHNFNSENITSQNIDASNQLFKDMVMGPIRLLMAFFNPSFNVDRDKWGDESKNRGKVFDAQADINGTESNTNDKNTDETMPSLKNPSKVNFSFKVGLDS